MEAAAFPLGWNPYLWKVFLLILNSWKHGNPLVLASLDLKCCVQFKFATVVKNPPVGGTRLGFNPWVGKAMATHSHSLAWEIPWTEEPGQLQAMGPQTVGPNWATEHTHIHTHSIKLLIVHIIYYKGKGEKGNVWNSPYLLWNISEKFTFISLLTSFSLKFFKMRWLILGNKASQMALWVENLLAMQETWVWPLGWDPLEEGMAVHWRIP